MFRAEGLGVRVYCFGLKFKLRLGGFYDARASYRANHKP